MAKRLEIVHRLKIFVQYQHKTMLSPSAVTLSDRLVSKYLVNKLRPDQFTAIITLYSGYTNTDVNSVIQFLKSKNIKKIYFFIEDVLRLYVPNASYHMLESFLLEEYPSAVRSYELDIISSILQSHNCKYQLYLCENNSDTIVSNYNLIAGYFDKFLANLSIVHTSKKQNIIRVIKNYNTFDKKITCLNRRREPYRHMFMSLIFKFDGYFSLHEQCSCREIFYDKGLPIDQFSYDIKEHIIVNFDKIDINSFEPYSNELIFNNHEIQLDFHINSKSFLTVVSETRFVSPMPNISEKTLKPIIALRPFVLLAPPGSLKLLKSLGFKTFDNWWDESYDLETDHVKRLEKVYNIVSNINNMSNTKLHSMLGAMSNVLVHNRAISRNLLKNMYLLDINDKKHIWHTYNDISY